MTQEHPFAPYIRIIGKGPHLSRPLTEQESYEAACMIMDRAVEPVQIGAFLCVLRVRTEDPEEAAGFVRAVKERLDMPADRPAVDLDWPSYAGKARQLPWYLLATKLLADSGVTVFIHGEEGHTAGRVYSREVLEFLGHRPAGSLAEAADQLRAERLSYLPLDAMAPPLHDIMSLKPLLGLRSPIHTFARMINPFDAPYTMHGIFHPGYRDVHREAGVLLGQKNMVVFKGDGGEAERRPTKPVLLQALMDGRIHDEEWPAMLTDTDEPAKLDDLDPRPMADLWADRATSDYGTSAVIGTVAIALWMMGRAKTREEAERQARELWDGRDRNGLKTAA